MRACGAERVIGIYTSLMTEDGVASLLMAISGISPPHAPHAPRAYHCHLSSTSPSIHGLLGNEVTFKKEKILTASKKLEEKKRAARRQAALPTDEEPAEDEDLNLPPRLCVISGFETRFVDRNKSC